MPGQRRNYGCEGGYGFIPLDGESAGAYMAIYAAVHNSHCRMAAVQFYFTAIMRLGKI